MSRDSVLMPTPLLSPACLALCLTMRPYMSSNARHYGVDEATSKVKKMFPKCCSTRWGSVHMSEERLLAAGAQKLRHVLQEVLDKSCSVAGTGLKRRAEQEPDGSSVGRPRGRARGRGRGRAQSRGGRGGDQAAGDNKSKSSDNLNPDTLAVEAVQEYQQRMGKWRQHCLDVLADPVFEPIVQTMNAAREQVIRCSRFLLKKIAPCDVHLHGNHLTQLVNGKAEELFSNIQGLL